jgi:sulfur-oxidizing protein SoxY
MNRRTFIYGAAAFTAAGAGLLRPGQIMASPWPEAAFRRNAMLNEILQALYGSTNVQTSDAITLKAPLEPANGANVPVEVATTLPEAESIALISLNNPVPLLTRLRLDNAAPYYAIRVKLGETTRLSAYVRSRGHLYVASQDIKVTVGGCGTDVPQEGSTTLKPSYVTKMRVRPRNERMEALVLIKHPMETGVRKDEKSGRVIAAHFIQTMTFSRNGKIIAEADLGGGVAKDPLIGIALSDARPGDRIGFRWLDNHGESGGADDVVA